MQAFVGSINSQKKEDQRLKHANNRLLREAEHLSAQNNCVNNQLTNYEATLQTLLQEKSQHLWQIAELKSELEELRFEKASREVVERCRKGTLESSKHERHHWAAATDDAYKIKRLG